MLVRLIGAYMRHKGEMIWLTVTVALVMCTSLDVCRFVSQGCIFCKNSLPKVYFPSETPMDPPTPTPAPTPTPIQHSTLAVLCDGNPPVSGRFPHKGSVILKAVPWYDIIMAFFFLQWPWPSLVLVLYRTIITIYIWAWLIYSVVLMPVFPPPQPEPEPVTVPFVSTIEPDNNTSTLDPDNSTTLPVTSAPTEEPVPTYGHVWPAFLTNWSYTVLAIYLTVATIVCVRRALKEGSLLERPLPLPDTSDCFPRGNSSQNLQDQREAPLPWDLKIEWCLFAIISNFVFIITLIYFGILYPRLVATRGYHVQAVDVHIHGVNSIVIVIEMFLAAYPVRLLHIIYPILYGLAYVIFSLLYFATDPVNHIVYRNVLDWRYPGQTIGVILGLALIVIPIFQLMLFGLYRLRLWIYKTYVRSWVV